MTLRTRLTAGALASTLTAVAVPVGMAQDGDVIRSYSLKLDRRAHVAVVRVVLSRRAPVGIIVQGVGRVPLGRPRAAAAARVRRTFVWDLSLPDGRYLRPGRYTTVLRALNSTRKRVIDRSDPVELRIPRSFRSPPRGCGS